MTMRDVNRAIALSGWIFILATCATIVATYCAAEYFHGGAGERLTGDFRMAIAFLFGAATTFVQNLTMKPEQ